MMLSQLKSNDKTIHVRVEQTLTRSKCSDVTENRPLICTRLALDLSSKESLNPTKSVWGPY